MYRHNNHLGTRLNKKFKTKYFENNDYRYKNKFKFYIHYTKT